MAPLPENLRSQLAGELEYAAGKMREATDPSEKLFYFSVTYSETNRTLNRHWDRDLSLLHDVVEFTHHQINGAAAALRQGGQRPIILPDDFYDRLTAIMGDLVRWVTNSGNGEQLCEILGRLTELRYITTGNGYYLLRKGHIIL